MESGLELVQLMAADRYIEDLDYDHLPNAKSLPDYASTKNYVMSVASIDGIVYNQTSTRSSASRRPRYSDLEDPKLKGRVAFPDINHTQHWNAVAGLAYEAGANEANLEPGIPQINKIKPAYFFARRPISATKMGSGEIWAAPWHAGFVVRLRRNNVPLSIAYPQFGTKRGALWPVMHHIVRGTQNALAEKFLDPYLDPELQFEHASGDRRDADPPAAVKKLATDPENKNVLPFKERLDNLYVVDFTKVNLPRMAHRVDGMSAQLIAADDVQRHAANVWSSATATSTSSGASI